MAKVKSIVRKGKFYRFSITYIIMFTNNKIHKFCVLEGKFTQTIKLWDLICQLCLCYSNIYIMYRCKHETIRNQLIGYYRFGNNRSINQLFGENAQHYMAVCQVRICIWVSTLLLYHPNTPILICTCLY